MTAYACLLISCLKFTRTFQDVSSHQIMDNHEDAVTWISQRGAVLVTVAGGELAAWTFDQIAGSTLLKRLRIALFIRFQTPGPGGSPTPINITYSKSRTLIMSRLSFPRTDKSSGLDSKASATACLS
jgi:hypothetical protein